MRATYHLMRVTGSQTLTVDIAFEMFSMEDLFGHYYFFDAHDDSLWLLSFAANTQMNSCSEGGSDLLKVTEPGSLKTKSRAQDCLTLEVIFTLLI